MALHMATSYGPQDAQVNEKPALKSYLDLTLTQHPYDENSESQQVHTRFEVNPSRTWYYHISSNFRTLMIFVANQPHFWWWIWNCMKGCYKTEDTSIYTWSLIPRVRHYRWLHNLICWLFPNNKVDYLVRTIQRILNFL